MENLLKRKVCKVCNVCNKNKAIKSFNRLGFLKDGAIRRRPECKDCYKIIDRRYGNERNRMFKIRHPEKEKAHHILRNHVGNGLIVKPTICSVCNKKFIKRLIQGHHSDYSKPLEVIWVCSRCHADIHMGIEKKTYRLPMLKVESSLWKFMNEEEIRKEINRLRVEARMTKVDLKNLCGFSSATKVHNIENGLIKLSVGDLNKIFWVFNSGVYLK